ncbi:MAG: hypothetical protein J5802_05095 [Butyrivibrio sp.]|nr:hypothetical protein [Butyrivibrio sp.]
MRVCNNCGTMMEDNMVVCPNCLKTIDGTEQMIAPTYYPYVPMPQQTPQLGLKWANFLGYFSLWLGALIEVISGVKCLEIAGTETMYLGLGLVCIVAAIFSVIAAIKIIKRMKDAKLFVCALYALDIVSTVIAMLMSSSYGEFAWNRIISIMVSVSMIFINNYYFDNRKDIFIN